MTYVRTIDPDQAEGALARVYDTAIKRAGGVANIIRTMSQDGPSTQGSMQFYMGIMKSPNALRPARREMLATVVSNVNDCYY